MNQINKNQLKPENLKRGDSNKTQQTNQIHSLNPQTMSLFFEDYQPLSEKFYQSIISYDLILKQNFKTPMQLPCLDKIVLSTTSKNYVLEKKNLLVTLAAFELISGQKPKLTLAKQSVSNFKIRQDQILGCKVVLQKKLMYEFLDKLSQIIFPRLREHKKKQINACRLRKVQGFCSLNYGIQNLMTFPELENHYELVDSFKGMNLTIIMSNSTPQISFLILTGFQLPFLP